MIILPAIDLLDGQVVRLREGKLADKTVYSDDPLGFARRWEEEGGNCLHLVDLNAAFTGEPRNIEMIKREVAQLVGIMALRQQHVRCQFGQGRHAQIMVQAGVVQQRHLEVVAAQTRDEVLLVGLQQRQFDARV